MLSAWWRFMMQRIRYEKVALGGARPLTENDIPAINALLKQLRDTLPERTLGDIEELLRHGAILIVARHSGRIVGMGTLIVVTGLAFGRYGILDDIVVDASMQKQGVGTGIMNALITQSRHLALAHLDLTSGRKRIAAQALYRSVGFEVRPTRPWRLVLK